ncbi:MAG: helix-turn-helix domain-containing protein [Solirubrobacterales bacterium]|nr:helix-turn-helix domain-containing protein [Solirubrobacterales bacterium]
MRGEKLARQTLTIEEAGTILGIGRTAAYEAARCGQIPVVRIGRRLLVPRIALENLLSGGSGSPPASPHRVAE